MAGWGSVLDQFGGQWPSRFHNNGQNRRQDVRDWRQGQNQGGGQNDGRRRPARPQGEYTVTTPGTPGNQDPRDLSAAAYQGVTQAAGGAPMSYYDYAMANSGGGAAVPTAVNNMPMYIPTGTTNLQGNVTTTDPYSEGQAFGSPTVTQTFNTVPQRGNRNNRNRR